MAALANTNIRMRTNPSGVQGGGRARDTTVFKLSSIYLLREAAMAVPTDTQIQRVVEG